MKKLIIVVAVLVSSCTTVMTDGDNIIVKAEPSVHKEYKFRYEVANTDWAGHEEMVLYTNKEYYIGDTLRIIK